MQVCMYAGLYAGFCVIMCIQFTCVCIQLGGGSADSRGMSVTSLDFYLKTLESFSRMKVKQGSFRGSDLEDYHSMEKPSPGGGFSSGALLLFS